MHTQIDTKTLKFTEVILLLLSVNLRILQFKLIIIFAFQQNRLW